MLVVISQMCFTVEHQMAGFESGFLVLQDDMTKKLCLICFSMIKQPVSVKVQGFVHIDVHMSKSFKIFLFVVHIGAVAKKRVESCLSFTLPMSR